MRARYTLKEKALFYWKYFVVKFFYLWFEVRKPKFKMFLYEMLYSSMKFINRSYLLPSPFKVDSVETKFGVFRIRPLTVDMSNCSPAFERRDIDHLLTLMDQLRKEGRRMLFLDIGADIGTFTVTVGNWFKDYRGLGVMSFEPASSSFAILEENIKLNNLTDKADAQNFALFSEDDKELEFIFNTDAPGSSGLAFSSGIADRQKVKVKTLNTVLAGSVRDYDVILFKIDVEGVETEVLKGADNILNSGKDIYLLIEDFVNPEILVYLENMGAKFTCKLTPYNSWWHYRSNFVDR